jgi:hypothetical protein
LQIHFSICLYTLIFFCPYRGIISNSFRISSAVFGSSYIFHFWRMDSIPVSKHPCFANKDWYCQNLLNFKRFSFLVLTTHA